MLKCWETLEPKLGSYPKRTRGGRRREQRAALKEGGAIRYERKSSTAEGGGNAS